MPPDGTGPAQRYRRSSRQPGIAYRLFVAACFAALVAGLVLSGNAPARGRDAARPGVGPEDRRQRVGAQEQPWASLARIRTDHGVLCTGAMISRDAVLTAAHCLLSPRSGTLVAAEQVTVALGYDAGEVHAHARGKIAIVAPGYEAVQPDAPSRDWALIILERELPAKPLPFAASTPNGSSVMLGGWQHDRAQVLQADTDCRVKALLMDAASGLLLQHDCAGTRGVSGAPLLVQSKIGWAIAGVAIRASDRDRGGTAIASSTVLTQARGGLTSRPGGERAPAAR